MNCNYPIRLRPARPSAATGVYDGNGVLRVPCGCCGVALLWCCVVVVLWCCVVVVLWCCGVLVKKLNYIGFVYCDFPVTFL